MCKFFYVLFSTSVYIVNSKPNRILEPDTVTTRIHGRANSTIIFKSSTQKPCSNVENGIDMCDYLSNQEMKEKLYELNETYWGENLVSLSSLGKSVLGEELFYLKITSNANKERMLLKPMFK